MNPFRTAGSLLFLALLFPFMLFAAQDHSAFVKGPFKTGPDVTKVCLQCHQEQAKAFMKTVHWTWSSRQRDPARGEVKLGKINAVNNFCIALPSNEPRCTSCHAGYGWKDASFDFGNPENIDCLVCHDGSGTYRKYPIAAGHPAYKDTEWPVKSGKKWAAVNLEKVAKSVALPSRQNCGACHFFAGGGDHVKHGDLDSSLIKPNRSMDVHMAVDGVNMTCVDCHKGKDHVIPGKALSVSVSSGGTTLGCATCHAGKPHTNERVLMGETIDPGKVVHLNYPQGKRDASSKFAPFKLMRGKQPYDSGNNVIAVPHLFGKGGYWQTYNWGTAIASGMKIAGVPYSGKYGWVETDMHWKVNHMVAPKAQALKCDDCHSANGRLDWAALGYSGDPRELAKRRR